MPFAFGNCQAGWHAMMAACMRPDVVGPMVIAGAPLSYWGGVRGKNTMRYLGGWYGGTWLDRMMSDIGNGIFDAAWLVANFDNLNPANTLWTKQYNVWANPEQEKNRYLQFEKWWGDFVRNYPPPFLGRRYLGRQAKVSRMVWKGFAPLSLAVSTVVLTSASAFAAHMAR